MAASDDASPGLGRPVGAAMAVDRTEPASDKAKARLRNDDFNMQVILGRSNL